MLLAVLDHRIFIFRLLLNGAFESKSCVRGAMINSMILLRCIQTEVARRMPRFARLHRRIRQRGLLNKNNFGKKLL
jgi:hypothetical protein